MPSYGKLWPIYAGQWNEMQRTRLSEEHAVAEKLLSGKDRYLAVEKKTGVPWYMIAAIHYRESDINWNTQLAQGDPLHSVSTHVPKGMGPFSTWEAGAVAALEHEGFNKVIDWRLEKVLFHLEAYNGWGYYKRDVPSPYVWAGSSVQKPGKYVADGVWDPGATDTQLGCAPIIKSLVELDPSIHLVRETPLGVDLTGGPIVTDTTQPTQVPSTVVVAPSQEQIDALAAALQKKMQPAESAMLTAVISAVVAALPHLGVWGLVASQLLASSGVMGAAVGAGTTPTGQAVATAFLGMLASGLVNVFNRPQSK